MAICLYLWDAKRQERCQKQNREAKQKRIETRQGGRSERTETRQGGRTDRVETRVEGGATLAQGLGSAGASIAGVLTGAPPSGSVASGAGGLSPTTVLVGAAALAAVLLFTGDKK